MFGRRKQIPHKEYDRENYKAIVRSSICTGEQVAGFKNIHTGKFEEVMLIRDGRDLDEFMDMYDIAAITKEY